MTNPNYQYISYVQLGVCPFQSCIQYNQFVLRAGFTFSMYLTTHLHLNILPIGKFLFNNNREINYSTLNFLTTNKYYINIKNVNLSPNY